MCKNLAILEFSEEERIALHKNQFIPLMVPSQILKKTIEDLIHDLTANK